MGRYLSYAEAQTAYFGEKVYKIPVNVPLTCPNRDGSCGSGGCTFCGEVGTGFENLSAYKPIGEQMKENIAYMGPKYKAKAFIAYFNNFTNTYCPPELLKKQMLEALVPGVVGFAISTRPDCVSQAHLDAIESVVEGTKLTVTLELGLQSVNVNTLKRINRGHGLAEFVEAVLAIKARGFRVCGHIIANLPWDTEQDVIEAAKLFSVLGVHEAKLHSLYILRHTELARQFEAGEFVMGSPEDYVSRVVAFVRHAHPSMVFQRFAGRAPEEETLFCNWGMSWWRLKDMIEEALEREDVHQGDLCLYMGGSAVQKFLK